MLLSLFIRDFAIVEQLSVEFDGGLTVLTGETGAGKSIMVDALGLVLGDRASSDMVKAGSERAEITAVFALDKVPAARQWLTGQMLDNDDECIVSRIIGNDGRTRCFINGRPSTVSALKELGEQLVDLHHQHAHQSLLRGDGQRRIVDAFAGHESLLAEVERHWRTWRELEQERTALDTGNSDVHARLELLRYQCQELDALDLEPGTLAALEADHARLSNISELQTGCQQALQMACGDEGSASDLLGTVLHRMHDLQAMDPALQPMVELLDSATIQLHEFESSLRGYQDGLETDPETLAGIDQQLGLLHDLARKHQVRPAELATHKSALHEQLQTIEHADSRAAELDQLLAAARHDYDASAEALSRSRDKAGKKLGRLIGRHLKNLDMPQASLSVVLKPVADDTPRRHGRDTIEFQVCTNAGQPSLPLAKIASGGELSRISLAIQVVATRDSGVPVLIFDEIDVGIGGGTAEVVGQLLRDLGQNRQVLCVTHQAQVAAQGHRHLLVEKLSGKRATQTRTVLLDDKRRIDEIARMLGGVEITAKTRAHAKEMLQLGQVEVSA